MIDEADLDAWYHESPYMAVLACLEAVLESELALRDADLLYTLATDEY